MSVAFSIVVAADEARGIGKSGALPWHLPGDMAFFKRVTTEAPAGKRNVVIMGRKTYASIPPRFRPLKERENLVLSRSPSHAFDGALACGSLDEALAHAERHEQLHQVFVIGGGELYREALLHPACARVLLTRVHARFDCDTFLPEFEHQFDKVHSDGPHRDDGVSYTFETYARRAAR